MPDTEAIPRATFEAVLGGLLEIEELLAQLTHSAARGARGSRGTAQTAGVRQLLQRYVTQVEEWIKAVTVTDEAAAGIGDAQAPMVMVGAIAHVTDPDTGDSFPIRVVGPNQGDRAAHGEQVVSVLSPLGQALLLARPGDTIQVAAPMGTLTYIVEKVGFPL